jgi:hypothetical protein
MGKNSSWAYVHTEEELKNHSSHLRSEMVINYLQSKSVRSDYIREEETRQCQRPTFYEYDNVHSVSVRIGQ